MRLLTAYERGYKVGLEYDARVHLGNIREREAVVSEYCRIVEEVCKKGALENMAKRGGFVAGWMVSIW